VARTQQIQQDPDRRRLAGAVQSKEPEDLTALDVEGDTPNRVDVAVRFGEIANGDGRPVSRQRHG
jgi:hypothetical protein